MHEELVQPATLRGSYRIVIVAIPYGGGGGGCGGGGGEAFFMSFFNMILNYFSYPLPASGVRNIDSS